MIDFTFFTPVHVREPPHFFKKNYSTHTRVFLIDSIWENRVQPVVGAPLAEKVGRTVVLTATTTGASIGYQVVKKDEDAGDVWHVYTGPVEVKRGRELLAVSDRIGYKASEILRVR